MYRDVDGASMPRVLRRDPLSGLPAASAEGRSQGKDHSRGIQVIARFVDQVPGRQRLAAMSAVGERFPLHCTANGKAILACMAEADVLELVDKSIAEHPDHPLTDHNALMHDLGRTRQTHLAFDFEEHREGITAVGTALLDWLSRPIAISIPMPSLRFADRQDEIAVRLLQFRERVKGVLRR
jgi:DNA-binding IclR family transcriptional regulator